MHISINPHAPRIKGIEYAKDIPENTDCIIDQSSNGINYAKRIGDIVYVQTHRWVSYDKHPRQMTSAEFDQWRKECRMAANNDRFFAPVS